MKIVLDTNILLVSISPKSMYHWVYKAFQKEYITLCVSSDILLEYEEIIDFHMGREVAKTVLQVIENAVNIEFVTTYFQWQLIEKDTDDNKFVDVAVGGNAKFIVSHDKHFSVLKEIPFP